MASGCHTGQSKAKSEKNLDFFFNTQFNNYWCCLLHTRDRGSAKRGEMNENLPALRQVLTKETAT